MFNLLSIVTFLPTVAALVLAVFLRGGDEAADRNAKWLAMFASIFTFLASLIILIQFDPNETGFQMVEEAEWIMGLKYKMGVDGISVLFVILTTFIMPMVIAVSWTVTKRVKEYMIAFLILETMILGVFMALDIVMFYMFFEAGLIPMFLIIGIWGGPRRVYASFKFFLYTFLGSVLMLMSMIGMYVDAGTTDIVALLNHSFSYETMHVFGVPILGGLQTLLFLGFFVSLGVKMPMWPVHTWLPDAHVEAPTAGSVELAAVLLKVGGYAYLRFCMPMFPVGAEIMEPVGLWLSAIAIVYASFVAIAQEDMKKMIAYSSVAHMGFVTLGIFSMNQQGVEGAIFQMLSHGFTSGALFLCVGVLYDRIHTREISAYGGVVNRMPTFAAIFMLFTMANVGLPGTSGFVGEFLSLAGAFQVNTWVAAVSTTGVILSACYALWLYRRVVMGDLIKESLKGITDLNMREKCIFAPLVACTLLFGVYPAPILDRIEPSVRALVLRYNTAIEESGFGPVPGAKHADASAVSH